MTSVQGNTPRQHCLTDCLSGQTVLHSGATLISLYQYAFLLVMQMQVKTDNWRHLEFSGKKKTILRR